MQPCGNSTVYCPEGSAGPVAVPSGSYSTPEASDASLRDGAAVCPSGMYCVGGVKVCHRVCEKEWPIMLHASGVPQVLTLCRRFANGHVRCELCVCVV
jgi:hypothetical protein